MPEGSENVNIGEPIAIVVENKDDIPAFASVTKDSLEGGAAPAASQPAAEATPAPAPAQPAPAQPAQPAPAQPAQSAQSAEATPAPAGQNRVFISPLAKTILKNSGSTIDISTIKGTGPQGRIVAADVLAAVSSKAPATPAASTPAATATAASTVNYEDVPVTPMRKVISTRLSESKQTIPHYYVNQNCYVDELLKVLLLSLLHSQLRTRLNQDIAQVRNPTGSDKPVKVTINDFIVKACAMALREVSCSIKE